MGLRDRLKESGRKAREKNLQIQKEMEEEKNNKYNVEYGVKCKFIFPETELKIKTQSPAMKGMAAWSWGVVGLAMTSGVKTEEKRKSLNTIIQVVEKGVVLKNAQADGKDLRIPFDNIIRATDDKYVNGKFSEYLRLILLENQVIQISLITQNKLRLRKEVKQANEDFLRLVNERATGSQNEETGWGLDYAENENTNNASEENNSTTNELKEVMEMYKEGLLTDEEFAAMKKKIIEK